MYYDIVDMITRTEVNIEINNGNTCIYQNKYNMDIKFDFK